MDHMTIKTVSLMSKLADYYPQLNCSTQLLTMAPSIIDIRSQPGISDEEHLPRKRRKTHSNGPTNTSHAISPHPLRIKPLGNALTASSNLRDTSTGNFAVLPDESIVRILGFLDAASLLSLGATSKGFYAFSRFEELWKDLFTRLVVPVLGLTLILSCS